jgi:protoheme ferro-lyase
MGKKMKNKIGKDIEKTREEIKKVPESLIDIVKKINPKLEEQYDEIKGEENWILITEEIKEKKVILKGGLTYDIGGTYSITLVNKYGKEYIGPFKEEIKEKMIKHFLKSFNETLKSLKKEPRKGLFYKLWDKIF